LLVEPAATNGAPDVRHLKGPGVATASGGPTITTGSTDFLAPDGTSGSITKYVGGAASGNVQNAFYTGFSPTISAAGAYAFSLFVKAGATNPLNFCALSFTQYAGGSGTASYFSLASGTALTSGASIQNYGNGWYRIISAPYTIASGDLVGNVVFNLAEGNGDTSWPVSGALNLTAYVWGAQIEAGSVATSYIPTTTAAVTRNGDVIFVTGAVSGCIGQTEGSIYWDIAAVGGVLTGTGNPEFGVRNEAFTNWIGLTSNGTALPFRITARTTVGDSLINYQANIASGKAALAWSSAGLVLYVNGVSVATSATNPNFSFSRAIIGNTSTMPFKANAFALYTTRLTNAELAALTT
jgi:hypothetical protein